MTRLTHRDGTLPTNPDAVFVFGSNTMGKHIGGAAKVAAEKFGARDGICAGAWGFSYAIPTLDEYFNQLSLETIAGWVRDFLAVAAVEPDTEFFVTRIGCGIAGFADAEIAPLFKDAPTNCNFPEEWTPYV